MENTKGFIDFTDRVVLITGAASGIGRATAELFALAGANLALADRSGNLLAAAAARWDLPSERLFVAEVDVTSAEGCAAFARAAADRFGGIDVVVPSAGVYFDEPFRASTPAQWRRTMSVNIDGVFNTVHSALPLIRNHGSIVLLSSRAGHSGGSVGHVAYGTTKGAMLAMARGLARELGPHIRVNAVSPGVIDTPMVTQALIGTGDEIIGQTPLARLGTARDVANAILFLASDLASFITGETLQVNGGLYMS